MNPRPEACTEAGCLAPLSSFGCGKCVQVSFMCLDPEYALRLREMGLCEGTKAVIIQNTQNVILSINGTRLGLRKDLAMQLFGCEVKEHEQASP